MVVWDGTPHLGAWCISFYLFLSLFYLLPNPWSTWILPPDAFTQCQAEYHLSPEDHEGYRASQPHWRVHGATWRNMAQHGAWCNRSSVWSKHGTLKAFQHTSLEQGIFGNRTGMELLQTDVAWCGAKFDPRKSEVAAALWQMAFRRSPLWVAASSHMSCIMLYQFLNQVVSSGKCNMQIICNKLPVLWRAKYILPQEKW